MFTNTFFFFVLVIENLLEIYCGDVTINLLKIKTSSELVNEFSLDRINNKNEISNFSILFDLKQKDFEISANSDLFKISNLNKINIIPHYGLLFKKSNTLLNFNGVIGLNSFLKNSKIKKIEYLYPNKIIIENKKKIIKNSGDFEISITNQNELFMKTKNIFLGLNNILVDSLNIFLDPNFNGFLFPEKTAFNLLNFLKNEFRMKCEYKKIKNSIQFYFNNTKLFNLECEIKNYKIFDMIKIMNFEQRNIILNSDLFFYCRKICKTNIYYTDNNIFVFGANFFKNKNFIFHKNYLRIENIKIMNPNEKSIFLKIDGSMRKFLFFIFIISIAVILARIGYYFLQKNIEKNLDNISKEENKPIISMAKIFEEIKNVKNKLKNQNKKKIFTPLEKAKYISVDHLNLEIFGK